MLRKKIEAISPWNEKQIWSPDIMLAWVIAISSVTSIAIWGPAIGA
jgi:hypothetical protein